ncbi:endolytic transglycosylase MltG [Oryzihumus sp.]
MKEDHLVDSIFGDAGGEAPSPPMRRTAPPTGPTRAQHRQAIARQQREQRRRARRRRSRRFLVLTLSVVLVGGAAFGATQYLRPLVASLTASKDWSGSGTGAVTIEVHDGDSGRAIGATLEKAGVVKTASAFSDLAEGNPQAASIQPGSYRLRLHMSASAALALLLDPRNRTVPRVTLREGLWKSEVFATLSKATGVKVADYEAAAKQPELLGLPAAARGNVEGYLFPATYEFPLKATAAEQLRIMVSKSVAELQQLGVSPASMERTVIIASIVEAEGMRDADRPKIARVIENRLARKMKLQMDSTVSYGVQHRAITTTNAERAANNGYNTYRVAGLPVGPISNPGAASIQAAAHPAAGPWLYFVAVNPQTGETRFATDASSHAANVKLFQQWCSAHPGKC